MACVMDLDLSLGQQQRIGSTAKGEDNRSRIDKSFNENDDSLQDDTNFVNSVRLWARWRYVKFGIEND
jgi:hypothetical protein